MGNAVIDTVAKSCIRRSVPVLANLSIKTSNEGKHLAWLCPNL